MPLEYLGTLLDGQGRSDEVPGKDSELRQKAERQREEQWRQSSPLAAGNVPSLHSAGMRVNEP